MTSAEIGEFETVRPRLLHAVWRRATDMVQDALETLGWFVCFVVLIACPIIALWWLLVT